MINARGIRQILILDHKLVLSQYLSGRSIAHRLDDAA